MGERKYTGDEKGIDLSWQSHLQESWAENPLPPRPKRAGETVGGTTADDFHDTRTSFLPNHLQQESLTALQLDIVRTAVILRDATAMEIAAAAGASHPWVQTTISEYLPDHPAADHSPTSPHPDQTEIGDF